MIPVLAAIGSALALFLIAILAAKRPFRIPDVWLLAWLGGQALTLGSILVSFFVGPALAMAVLIMGQLAVFSLGPTQYLHAATAFDEPPRYRLHTLISIGAVAVIISLSYLLSTQADSGALIVNAPSRWVSFLPPLALTLTAIWPLLVIRMVHRRQVVLKDNLANLGAADPTWISIWAWASLAVYGLNLIMTLSAALGSFASVGQIAVMLLIQIGQLAFVGHQGLTRSRVFFSAVRKPESNSVPDQQATLDDFGHVQAILSDKKPYLDPDLTAAMLADIIGWAPYRLSDAIKLGGKTTFFDLINGARVREVQSMVSDSRFRRVSTLTLGLDAGFGSKSALYVAFKKHSGMTPGTWRQTHTL